MNKKGITSFFASVAMAAFMLVSPVVDAQITSSFSVHQIDEGDCEKCGKKECKGCENEKAESKKEMKSCAGKGEGKSCCAGSSKKEAKPAKKEKGKK